jgi:hypothetical protein
MNEAAITRDLKDFLISKNGGGPVIKHSDQSTLGLPDLSVTGAKQTVWIEVKLVKFKMPKPVPWRKIVGYNKPQYRCMTTLDFHGASAVYVIFFYNGKQWWMKHVTGCQMANLCNLDRTVTPAIDMYVGKSFEDIWHEITRRRKERDAGL